MIERMLEEEKTVLDALRRYIDLSVTYFGKERREGYGFEVERRAPMYGGNGVVHLVSLFEKGELVNNRIGVYMVLMNHGDEAGFHEHGSRREQELYVVVNGEGEYTERQGETNVVRTVRVQKGSVTAIQGTDNFHSLKNTGGEPLVVFVVTTNEKD